MFKTETTSERSSFSWLEATAQLSPPYDYFDFVDAFGEDQRTANRWYMKVMQKALKDAKDQHKFEIVKKKNQ
ncbi:hypothetical protein EDC94DRAFT_55954 [Helicostylum pulchrum]|nr:hypothetical protein EDC94DRAFT_55954 [Helicostylum pulchrum]